MVQCKGTQVTVVASRVRVPENLRFRSFYSAANSSVNWNAKLLVLDGVRRLSRNYQILTLGEELVFSWRACNFQGRRYKRIYM